MRFPLVPIERGAHGAERFENVLVFMLDLLDHAALSDRYILLLVAASREHGIEPACGGVVPWGVGAGGYDPALQAA